MVNTIYDEIKKSITFIYIKDVNNIWVPNGTGFFVGIKNELDPLKYNVYLVTAKHVLKDEKENYYRSIKIKLNRNIGESSSIEIELSKVDIFTHSDNDVDIALFSCLPDQKIYDFKFIPGDMITNKETIEKHDISEGDDVFFSGLFTSHIGQKRNQPIVRFGKVALISDEKIEWKEKDKPPKYLDLYLLECQSFGGNSGSPVFFQLNPLRRPGQLSLGSPNVYLAGVMTGSFLNGNEIKIIETKTCAFSLENLGIAAVTPSYKLHEIMFSEQLIETRKKITSQQV